MSVPQATSPTFTRRTLLGATVLASLAAAGCRGSGTPDPFTLGVASGDPSPDGFVLWTRLAPHPLADDGRGGMPAREVDVEWEVGTDERLTRIERRGVVTAVPASAHAVHVELAGLRPGRDYFYRFRTAGHLSATGRTRTAPAPDSLAPLTVCAASCANYEQGWFTAYRRLAEEHPDLVLHLGDYSYEFAADTHIAPGGNVRRHVGPQTRTLAHYRQRYAQYRTDPDLQAAHAAAPWLVVFDDHELVDNWAGGSPAARQPGQRARRSAALRAYYENMPLRRSAAPRGAAMRLYRRVHWGALATFHMLDTRQYRDAQLCGDRIGVCPGAATPGRSILGADQEKWLQTGLANSRARWDLLGQQVFFARLDFDAGPARAVNPDAWDGYAACRDRVVAGLARSPVRNAVVLTGDVHSHWAAQVRRDSADPASPVVATELVTSSITSGGDGSDSRPGLAGLLADNTHIRYFSNRRGYLRARLGADELRADFRVLPYVSRPDAPVGTGASFVVADRAGQLRRL
ncbi:alkaline phosphatase D family protein [Mycolicibacterium palauense]|uniref:alkaline phosphatase D family protein n=1 Tax=Mycolicibacterium palauense TaxID=2034511 RepID=UPI000BFEF2F5|nr:alkaline phosphatase D family protein [Mycolicibacterium palauense]